MALLCFIIQACRDIISKMVITVWCSLPEWQMFGCRDSISPEYAGGSSTCTAPSSCAPLLVRVQQVSLSIGKAIDSMPEKIALTVLMLWTGGVLIGLIFFLSCF